MSLISSWSWSRTEPPPNSPSPPCRWLLPRLSPVRDSFLFSDAVADFGVKPGGTYGTSVDSYRVRQRPSPTVVWLVGCVTGSVTRCLTRWIQCSRTRIYGHRQASRVVWRDVEQDREQPPPVGTPPLLLGASHPATPLPRSNSYGDEQLDGMDASFSKPVAGFIETEIVELSVRTYRPLSPYDATRKLT